MKLVFNKETIKKYHTYGAEIEAFVHRKGESAFYYYEEENPSYPSIPVRAHYNRYSSSHSNLEEAEKFLNVINEVIPLLPREINHTLFFDKFYFNISDRFIWLDYDVDKLKKFILHTVVNKWNEDYNKSFSEFDNVLSKHENDYEGVTFKEENELYELSRSYGFTIPEKFVESKSAKRLKEAVRLTDELLKKLNAE